MSSDPVAWIRSAPSESAYDSSRWAQKLRRFRASIFDWPMVTPVIDCCFLESASMARRRRVFVPGAGVHVFQRGNNRGPIFWDDEDRTIFLAYLSIAVQTDGVAVHNFSLMDTHYHLVVTPDHRRALPKAIQRFGSRYVQYYNKRHARTGTLWDGRYKGEIIEDERYLFTCFRYVEQNAVKAGIVAAPGAYRWSSYRNLALGEASTWLVPHRLYLALGPDPESRQAAYRALCAVAPAEDDQDPHS